MNNNSIDIYEQAFVLKPVFGSHDYTLSSRIAPSYSNAMFKF